MTDNELFFILTFTCLLVIVSVWAVLYRAYRKEQQKDWLRENGWRLYMGGWVSNRHEDRDSPIEILSFRKAVRIQRNREWRERLPAPSRKAER